GVLNKEIRGRRPATSAELASLILEEAEVAVVPGEAFGPSGYMRLSYATSDEDIIEGVSRIKNLLSEAK
ncbi:MAG: aminotransferase class I/II-fold pyridoxal phosphate-dependent enzyme, partial [Actinomycetota bacterium]